MDAKNIKVDITSTVAEKGLDAAKAFLGKLISPALEEAGLLLRDSISIFRFRRQVITLTKAREYCIKHNISLKTISLKLLCPLLENASLEEDEFLTDKWAALLSNLVDSEQNIENHVFPFLLSQISRQEFQALETAVHAKEGEVVRLKSELDTLKRRNTEWRKRLSASLDEADSFFNRGRSWAMTSEMEDDLGYMSSEESKLELQIKLLECISSTLQAFEFANLVRLGVAKSIPRNSVQTYARGIEGNTGMGIHTLNDLEVEILQEGEDYFPTELGKLFIRACTEKESK